MSTEMEDSAEYDEGLGDVAKLRVGNLEGGLSDKAHHQNVIGVRRKWGLAKSILNAACIMKGRASGEKCSRIISIVMGGS